MKHLGIDLGGTKTKFGVVENGQVIFGGLFETPRKAGYHVVVEAIAGEAAALLKKYPDIETVGIGSPGLIDTEAGLVCFSNNFGWKNKPMQKDLENMLKLPVNIANDATCAALAEARFGAGQLHERVAMLTIGTGIGGGFIVGGKLDSGRYGSMAYIFGHTVIQPDGRQCNCGRSGCIETYTSATAIADENSTQQKQSAQEIFDNAKKGDSAALAMLDNFKKYLAEGAVNIANILRPNIIVMGGGVSASSDLFLPYINASLENGVYGYEYAPVIAAAAKLGNLAGVVGAACLAKQ